VPNIVLVVAYLRTGREDLRYSVLWVPISQEFTSSFRLCRKCHSNVPMTMFTRYRTVLNIDPTRFENNETANEVLRPDRPEIYRSSALCCSSHQVESEVDIHSMTALSHVSIYRV
jgi:hypothetical protein